MQASGKLPPSNWLAVSRPEIYTNLLWQADKDIFHVDEVRMYYKDLVALAESGKISRISYPVSDQCPTVASWWTSKGAKAKEKALHCSHTLQTNAHTHTHAHALTQLDIYTIYTIVSQNKSTSLQSILYMHSNLFPSRRNNNTAYIPWIIRTVTYYNIVLCFY